MALPPKPAAFPSISEELLYNIAESTSGDGSSSSNLLFELENHTEFLGQIAQSLKDQEDNTAVSLLLLISQHTATIKDHTLALMNILPYYPKTSWRLDIEIGVWPGMSSLILAQDYANGQFVEIPFFSQISLNSDKKRLLAIKQIEASFADNIKAEYLDFPSDSKAYYFLSGVPGYYQDPATGNFQHLNELYLYDGANLYPFSLTNKRITGA